MSQEEEHPQEEQHPPEEGHPQGFGQPQEQPVSPSAQQPAEDSQELQVEEQVAQHQDTAQQAEARRLIETTQRVTHVAQSEEQILEDVPEEDQFSLNAVRDNRPIRSERRLSEPGQQGRGDERNENE